MLHILRPCYYGSVTFWYRSGSGSISADPYHCVTDPDPDPALFRQWLSRCGQKISFFAYYFLKVHLHQTSKIKSHKTVEIKVFFFLRDDGRILMRIQIRIRIRIKIMADPGRPKQLRIQRNRIRLHNTVMQACVRLSHVIRIQNLLKMLDLDADPHKMNQKLFLFAGCFACA